MTNEPIGIYAQYTPAYAPECVRSWKTTTGPRCNRFSYGIEAAQGNIKPSRWVDKGESKGKCLCGPSPTKQGKWVPTKNEMRCAATEDHDGQL